MRCSRQREIRVNTPEQSLALEAARNLVTSRPTFVQYIESKTCRLQR